jgi:hypothetical protein
VLSLFIIDEVDCFKRKKISGYAGGLLASYSIRCASENTIVNKHVSHRKASHNPLHGTCYPKPTSQDVSTIHVLIFPDEPDKISGHRWQHLNAV